MIKAPIPNIETRHTQGWDFFNVDGFWAAVLGALVVSALSWIVTLLISDIGKVVLITRRR